MIDMVRALVEYQSDYFGCLGIKRKLALKQAFHAYCTLQLPGQMAADIADVTTPPDLCEEGDIRVTVTNTWGPLLAFA